jgi:hypothetical protein
MIEDMLDDLDDLMPGTRSVLLMLREANSGLSDPIEVGSAELRPIDQKDELYLAGLGIEVEATLVHLWTPTIVWPSTPEVQRIPIHSVIQEPSGKKWSVETIRAELLGIRLRCLCVEFFAPVT